VLIIEDNIDAADSLREALELDAHQVAWRMTAPRAGLPGASILRSCSVTWVFRMTGYDVARAFRADQALKHTFLVAVTGYALPEDLQHASEAGFERHLAKPSACKVCRSCSRRCRIAFGNSLSSCWMLAGCRLFRRAALGGDVAAWSETFGALHASPH